VCSSDLTALAVALAVQGLHERLEFCDPHCLPCCQCVGLSLSRCGHAPVEQPHKAQRGGSDGDFKNMTFSRRVDESAAAVRWLAKQGSIDPAHITILGHSQGSYVATATAAMIPIILKIHSVVLWAPTVNPRLAYQHSLGRKLYERAMQAHKDEIIRWRGVSGRGRAFRAGFFHGLKNVNHGAELQKYTGRVLIVTGRHDRWSPTWAATEFSKQHGGETTIWEINTGHRMGAYGSRRDLNNFIDRTKKWLLK